MLGPWVNSRRLNLFTGAMIAVLVILSMILTASVLYPEISGAMIVEILVGGSVTTLITFLAPLGFDVAAEASSPAPNGRSGSVGGCRRSSCCRRAS